MLGPTAGDSAKALHALWDVSSPEEYRLGLRGLLQEIRGGGPIVRGVFGMPTGPHRFEVSNSLWVNNKYPLSKHFADMAASYYQTLVKRIDVTRPDTAAKQVNAWVAKASGNKIGEVVSSDSFTDQTRLRGAPDMVSVTANHPFLYLIRDTESGAILFIG